MPLLGLYRELVRRRYETPTRADEIHRVPCADGVRIAVKRFRPHVGPRLGAAFPASSALTRSLPVLCVPGLGADSTNFDAPEPSGLAPFLAQQGFDTWVVDPRGTGLSTVPKRRWTGISFDDFVGLDLPAIVDHVCASTKAPSLSWVGHSMGGLVLYGMLATGRAQKIHAAVTLGSPVGIPQGWQAVPFFKHLSPLADVVPALHVAWYAQALTPFLLRFDNPYLQRFMVLDNMDARYARRVMYRAMQHIPQGIMIQFRDWIEHDVFRSSDHSVDYRARMHGASLPVLVVGAPRDGLARVDAVRRAVSLLPNAQWFLAGKASGLSTDYGHIDLLFGRRAHEEIYPRVVEFLAAHENVVRIDRDRGAA